MILLQAITAWKFSYVSSELLYGGLLSDSCLTNLSSWTY